MQYRRAIVAGGTFFFTIVTYNRLRILCIRENVHLLRAAFRSVKGRYPFTLDAIVVLPDHIHCILTLPPDEENFSMRIRLLKSFFSRRCNRGEVKNTVSRINRNEKAVWQRRFWEHSIKDDEDYRRHIEYIHYNPVKHGLVDAPWDWEYSSFHSFVKMGVYDKEWGAGSPIAFNLDIGSE